MSRNILQVLVVIALLLWANAPVLGHQGSDHTGKEQEAASQPDSDSASARRRSGSKWGANYFPNVELVNQDGKSVRFFDDMIKDKVVIINFMYTGCGDTCPLETARLANVQRLLGDSVGKDIFMYSISVDPANDTPEVLKKYSEKFNVGPGWQFMTGKESDITLLRTKLGLYSQADSGLDPTDHNINLVLGNQRTGRWMKRSPFDNPYFLAAQVGSWLVNWTLPEVANNEFYMQAPAPRTHSLGEKLFRNRCIACHAIGEETHSADSGASTKKKQLLTGPNLLGVTQKRDREWLVRLIMEPDKMLAEKDPLFMELYTRYNNISMPNFRLGKIEAEALIDYIRIEGRRLEITALGIGAENGQ